MSFIVFAGNKLLSFLAQLSHLLRRTSLILMVKKKNYQNSRIRIEKVIKGKGDKLLVSWKGYDNSFNTWINKKDIVI